MVVYGHTPVPEPGVAQQHDLHRHGLRLRRPLTALRYPERELVSVPAPRTYYEPVRPLLPEGQGDGSPGSARTTTCSTSRTSPASASSPHALRGTVTIREENAAGRARGDEPLRGGSALADLPAADHVAARDRRATRAARAPARGVRVLPPQRRPAGRVRGEAHGLPRGGRRLPRAEAAPRDASACGRERGIIYTRTGRPFFADDALETALLDRVRQRACEGAGLWEELETDWLCLDARADAVVGQGAGAASQQYARRGAAAGSAWMPAAGAGASRRPQRSALRRSR